MLNGQSVLEESHDDSLSRSMVVPPTTSELDDVVLIVYLAVERGMNPAVWLESELGDESESGNGRNDDELASGADEYLLATEFFERMQSLKLVLRTWEFKAPVSGSGSSSVFDFADNNSNNQDPDSSDLSPTEKELICEMFGKDGDWEETEMVRKRFDGALSVAYVDVKAFLCHCYERMEDVELKFQARKLEHEHHLLEQEQGFDDSVIRSSLDELKMSRQARAEEREQETRRMNDFIAQQAHSGGILLSPEVVINSVLPENSPFDEEVAFDLDFDDEIDSQDGLDNISRHKEQRLAAQQSKMAELAKNNTKNNKATAKHGDRRSSRGGSRSGVASAKKRTASANRAAAAAAGDRDRQASEEGVKLDSVIDQEAVQLDVVEDLLRKLVKQSNLYLAVQKRFGFIEPTGDADSHVGPARTKVLKGYSNRLSSGDVQEGFLGGHLLLSSGQVRLLYLLVVKHAKCRLRKCGFLPKQQPPQAAASSSSSLSVSAAPSMNVNSSVDLGSVHGSSSSSSSIVSARMINSGGPRSGSAPNSPTRTKPLAYSPSAVTLNSAVSGRSSTGISKQQHGTSPAGSSPGTTTGSSTISGVSGLSAGVSVSSASNLRQSMQAAANSVSVPGKEKAVWKGKLSAMWLRDYLHLLRLTRKTVPTAAGLEILRAVPSTGITTHQSRSQRDRESKRAAASAIAAQAGEEEESGEEEDSDYDSEDDEEDDGDGQLPMPRALRKALAGKYFFISDHELDNLVSGYARSASLHGDHAHTHRGVVVPQAYLEKEVLLRVQRWVGNVDASNDFQHKLRTALRQHAKQYKSRQESPALSFEELRLQQQQVRQMLVDEKAEELRAEERLHGQLTKELLWKYLTYCRDSNFEGVCPFVVWLDWRHQNFSSTHRDVQGYRVRAGERLRSSYGKYKASVAAAAQAALPTRDGVTTGSGSGSGSGGNNSTKKTAFGGNTSIGRFGGKDVSAASAKNSGSSSKGRWFRAGGSPSASMTSATSSGSAQPTAVDASDDADVVAGRIGTALADAEAEQQRLAKHLLWKKAKAESLRVKDKEEANKQKKESRDKRRKKRAADAEFKTWLKLRAYKKFAVKDKKTGAILAIRDYPFKGDNPSLRVVHPKEWRSYVGPVGKKVVARVVKKNTGSADSAGVSGHADYTVLVKANPEEEEEEEEKKARLAKEEDAADILLKQQEARKAAKSRKAATPRQGKKGSGGGRMKKGTKTASGGILDVSCTSSLEEEEEE